MGILDFLDNPTALSNLLGINMGDLSGSPIDQSNPTAAQPPMPPTPPPQPPVAVAPPMQQQGGGIGSDYASSMQGAPGAPANPSIGNPAGDYVPGEPNMYAGAPGAPPMNASTPDFGPDGAPLPPSDPRSANAQVPLPPPRPTGAPQVSSAPLPPATPAPGGLDSQQAGGGWNMNMSRTDNVVRQPYNISPGQNAPLPPPNNGSNAPPTMSTGGGLAGALGIDPMRLRTALAGVGKGLSAVGSAPIGAPKGMQIARGLGGSLEGDEAQKQALFNQSSTAFKDMLAAKNQDDTAGYRKAQGQYLMARAQSLQNGGTATGSKAWQNTDYGKTIQVENEAQKFEKGQQILLQKQWAINGSSPEQQKQDLDDLGKKVDGYRQRLYKTAGIDPDKAQKLKDMGTTATNPFDTKGMSLEQFHDQVPMGAWFKDQNGVVRQRTVPPPGANAQPGSAPATGATAASAPPNNDDYQAMQPAA